MAATTSELIWLKVLLASLGLFHNSAMQLFCDSQAALHIAQNSVFHECTKHIELDYHFVWEKLDVGDPYVLLYPIQTATNKHIYKSSQTKAVYILKGQVGRGQPSAPT